MAEFPGLFSDVEFSSPEPIKDIFFDDFADFGFLDFKDVHVHEMDIYDNGEFINGFEIYYLVDGDVLKYGLHYRIQKGAVAAKKVAAPATGMAALLFGGGKPKATTAAVEEEQGKKTTIYFTKNEYIKRVKISGQTYLHYLEIENSKGAIVKCGTRKPDDHDCEFEVEDGYKIIAFSGVMQVMLNECRLLNLSITSK